MSENPDADHPRDRFSLDRIEDQALTFERAWGRERLHHAWLLAGPEGVGKASFAYRAARRLLGARPDSRFGPLGSSPEDPVCRLIASRAHPDLLCLERNADGARRGIPVEEARRLPEFFSKAPALGASRVAIIDAVDDLNPSGANAVLKTLEEPSARGVLFLISHMPGRLLPTIRSRCRLLSFRPWPEDAVAEALRRTVQMEAHDISDLAVMARGSPGRGTALSRGGALELDRLARALAEDLAPPRTVLASTADGFRAGEGAPRFALFMDRLAAAAAERAKSATGEEAQRWAELWDRLAPLSGRVEALNLDRADAFWTALSDVSRTARQTC